MAFDTARHSTCRLIVNCIDSPRLRPARITVHARREERLEFRFTPDPLPPGHADALLIPAEGMEPILRSPERLAGGPVLVHGPERELPHAFALGCRDYLREPWSYAELRSRILHHLPSRQLYCPVSGTPISLCGNRLQSRYGSAEISEGEARLLRVLLNRPGEPVFREALELALWGRRCGGSRALDMHISKLRKKIRSISRSGRENPIEAVRGIGYRISPRYGQVVDKLWEKAGSFN
jgi:hypothetical protein